MDSQGQHTIKVRAYNGNEEATATATFTIDNTPQVTITTPSNNSQVQGGFDITGTAIFKESIYAQEGSVGIFIDDVYYGPKWYEGTNITWKLSDITKILLDACLYRTGGHTIKVIATAKNWTPSTATSTFTIGTPTITISGADCAAGDIRGTATFEGCIGSAQGLITIYNINGYALGSKSYEGTDIQWKYSEITGVVSPLPLGGKGNLP